MADTSSVAFKDDELLAKVLIDSDAVDALAQHLAARLPGVLDENRVSTPFVTGTCDDLPNAGRSRPAR
jgi:hypothetical protein